MDVGALLRAAGDGDAEAWSALVSRYNGLVWSVVRAHRLGDADAADVAQTTWLRLAEHLADIRDADRLGAWLATTARHESLRVLRVGRRVVPTEEVEPADDGEAVALDTRMLTEERDVLLWRAFEKVSSQCRALLRLLVTDPTPSYEEISAATGLAIGSIGPIRGRCLERLRLHVVASGITAGAGDS